MFGKYQAIFRSRWRALWWSMGVLLTAYCTVPSQEQSEQGEDLAAVVARNAGHDDHAPPPHNNPWALRPAADR